MLDGMSRLLALAGLGLLAVAPSQAEGPYRNRDNKSLKDLSEGTYPVPYQKPTVAEITELLGRVRAYVDEAAPTRVVDARSGREISDFTVPDPQARVPDGEGEL